MTALPAPAIQTAPTFKVGDRVKYRETNKLGTVTAAVHLDGFRGGHNYIEVRFDDGWLCTYRATNFIPAEPDYRAIAEAEGWRMYTSLEMSLGNWTWINDNNPNERQIDCSDVAEHDWKGLCEYLELVWEDE